MSLPTGTKFCVIGIIFPLIVVDKHGSTLILLTSLSFTSIALLPKGEIEVVAHIADPITFMSLV